MPSPYFLRSMTSSTSSSSRPVEESEDADVLTAYDNLFLSFYNHAPVLSTTNIATAYVDSKLLLALASTFGALAVTGKPCKTQSYISTMVLETCLGRVLKLTTES